MATDIARCTALALLAQDGNVSRAARAVGVSRATIRYWRSGGGNSTGGSARPLHAACRVGTCPWFPLRDAAAYSYLMGLYLGDGCISASRRTDRLRIFLDDRYPAIQDECARAIEILSGKSAGRVAKSGCTEVDSYSWHWICLFPQHGPGRKHLRPIQLAVWQQQLVNEHPGPLLRGLIHSDGCRDLNVVQGRSYPRYSFSNRSADIQRVFQAAAGQFGLQFTVTRKKSGVIVTLIARRSDVALLDTFIGPKA